MNRNLPKLKFKSKEKGDTIVDGTLQSLGGGDNVGDSAKAGALGVKNSDSSNTVVLVSSAEEVCTPGTGNERRPIFGKRSRAATFPGATSSASSSDSKPPPQIRRKVEAKSSKKCRVWL